MDTEKKYIVSNVKYDDRQQAKKNGFFWEKEIKKWIIEINRFSKINFDPSNEINDILKIYYKDRNKDYCLNIYTKR